MILCESEGDRLNNTEKQGSNKEYNELGGERREDENKEDSD